MIVNLCGAKVEIKDAKVGDFIVVGTDTGDVTTGRVTRYYHTVTLEKSLEVLKRTRKTDLLIIRDETGKTRYASYSV